MFFELAIKVARQGVKYTQPDKEAPFSSRSEFTQSVDDLTAASQISPISFKHSLLPIVSGVVS